MVIKELVAGGGGYACPLTGAKLELDGARLRDTEDDHSYEIRNGVPSFLRYEEAETEESKQSLAKLNEIAARDGWRKAIEEVYAESPGQIRYNTDSERLGVLDLLPLSKESVVLEIGPALGLFTVELAKRAGMVHALEVVPGQAQFVVERCRQEGLNNVAVACGGDDCRLPFVSGLFDVVLINLVFEWCANRSDESFLDGQRRMLSEIHRVLKPGGLMLLTTKNRFALHYLVGKSDEHAHQMRFGNALPRWLTQALLRRRGKSRVAGLLHSHNRLDGLLREAGFDDLHSYWSAPEMRHPSRYVPTDAASIREARRDPNFVQGFSQTTRLLTPLIPAPFVKHFTPGLQFIARKPS